MRISDWSSDVCSSDLSQPPSHISATSRGTAKMRESVRIFGRDVSTARLYAFPTCVSITGIGIAMADVGDVAAPEFGFQNGLSIGGRGDHPHRSEEHTSELQSLMRNSYAVFSLKQHNKQHLSHA